MITKKYVRLIEDHFCKNCFLFPEENCFIPAGTEGVIIDEHTISLIPNLSDEEHSRIVSREVHAKHIAAYLVLINGRLVTISVRNLDFVRCDPPHPIFEDEDDWKQYIEDKLNQLLGDNHAST